MSLELAIAVASALTAAFCAFYVRFSGPVVSSQLLKTVLEDQEVLEAKWVRVKVNLEGIAEEISNDVEKATRIRNQIAARQSKDKGAVPQMTEMEAARMRFKATGVL